MKLAAINILGITQKKVMKKKIFIEEIVISFFYFYIYFINFNYLSLNLYFFCFGIKKKKIPNFHDNLTNYLIAKQNVEALINFPYAKNNTEKNGFNYKTKR